MQLLVRFFTTAAGHGHIHTYTYIKRLHCHIHTHTCINAGCHVRFSSSISTMREPTDAAEASFMWPPG